MSTQSSTSRRHLKIKELRCRRTGRMYTLQEHLDCPYCSGNEDKITQARRYSDFCEYEATDPIHFGFIEGTSRNEHG